MNRTTLQPGKQLPFGKGDDPGCKFGGISRYLGGFTGGAFAKLFFMKQKELDKQLHLLLENGIDEKFATFCNTMITSHPVALHLQDKAAKWKECLDMAMITFSSYKPETWKEYAEKAKIIVQQEMLTGRWNDIPSDEYRVGRAIAYCSYIDMAKNDADLEDTVNIYKFIGVETYAAVALNDCFDGYSYRRLFVIAWFTYFLEQLTLAPTDTPSDPLHAS